MRYLATASGSKVRDAMRVGLLDEITAPGWMPEPGVPFAVDNGRFGQHWYGYDYWWENLQRFEREHCLFVVAPDVVGDPVATLRDSLPWLPRIRETGFRAAFAGQDGMRLDDMPWDEFDVFFIGGGTEWKLGPEAAQLAKEALVRGKLLHMGRVNTRKRIRYAHALGCHSVDGTTLAYGADYYLPRIMKWMNEVNHGPAAA